MLVIFTIALLLLVLVNWEPFRSVFFPPVFFCLVWSALLAAIALSGDFFFPVSWATCTVYLLGAVAFCLGGRMVHIPFGGRGPTRALASNEDTQGKRFHK